MITLGSYSENNVSVRSSRKPENQMKSGLLCLTVNCSYCSSLEYILQWCQHIPMGFIISSFLFLQTK